MLKQRTTFVIGAGGSVDFGFPTGPGLQDKIIRYLAVAPDNHSFESEFVEDALREQLNGPHWARERSAYIAAAKRIIDAMPVAASIDNYLHTHRSDQYAVLLGKVAITLAIHQAEQNSKILVRPSSGFAFPSLKTNAYRDSWYAPFMRMLTMGSDVRDARNLLQNINFVCFNYDRCLELIILITLQSYYSISEKEAEDILAQANIVHPYGQIGDLVDRGGHVVPFGANLIDVSAVSSSIKTFTESVDENIVSKAKLFIENCDTLVFLGFGFVPQNMELLRPAKNGKARRIHATTFGISETDKLIVYDYLKGFMAGPAECQLGQIEYVGIGSTRSGFIDVRNGTCRDLFDNHSMRLAA